MVDFAHFWPAFASGFAFFVGSVLTLFLFALGRNVSTARAFGITTLCIAIWGLFSFLYDTTPVDQLGLARIWKGASQMLTAGVAASVSNFALVYYREIAGNPPHIYTVIRNGMVAIGGILALVLLSDILGFSQMGIREVVVGAKGLLEPIPGPLHHGVYTHFFAAVIFTSYVIRSVLKKNDSPVIRNQVRWIVWSLVIAMIAGGTRFATWYHVPVSPNIAAFAAPALGLGISYVITRHRLFNIKIISAEIFTFSIWTFLFFLVIFSETLAEYLINGTLLVATLILGSVLIKGALAETRQREELAEINKKLGDVNQILEQKVSERTRELSFAKLHTDAIIENLSLALIEYKPDFTITRVNRSAEELLGFKREHVIGRRISGEDITNKELSPLADILHLDPGIHENTGSGIAREAASDITVNYPVQRDLQMVTFSISSESKGGGQEVRFIKLIRDVTRERLIDKNKSDFIRIAAHQLRTPLSAIKWVFNIVIDGAKNTLGQEHLRMLKDGYTTNERVIALINDLLDVIRIEEGRFGYKFKAADIGATLKDVVEKVRPSTEGKRITLDIKLPLDSVPPFVFDEARIALALKNIIENAIFYTGESGRVTIEVATDGALILITIKDTGIGIPKEDIPKLLTTKFFRAINALKTQTEGSGLGLFIANNIIRAHKGTVSIDSEEHHGTTVSITIPATLKEGGA